MAGLALLPLLTEQLGGDHADNVTGGAGLGDARQGRRDELGASASAGAAIDNLEWLGGALLRRRRGRWPSAAARR